MDLSQFVYKTRNSSGLDVLYHSVTREELPADSKLETLCAHGFLSSQNNEALKKRLLTPPRYLALTLVPTWECNLRCNHCCVLHLLKKHDPHRINVQKLEKLLGDYFDRFQTTRKLQAYFLGGEAMLYPQEIAAQIDACKRVCEPRGIELILGITTNLAYDLNVENIRVLEQLKIIGVSLDGFETEHNKQRFYLNRAEGKPFQKTVDNIKRLVRCGLRDKLFVQGAVKDEFVNEEYIVAFTKFMMEIGVPLEKTLVGTIFPTKQKPQPSTPWLNHRTKSLHMRNKPCCKYQMMSCIQVNPDGSLWDNFYSQEMSQMGTLDNTLDEIIENNYNLIFNHMPALQDETCLACPALAYCWGGCIAGQNVMNKKPSEMCSREFLIPHLQSLAEKGELIDIKL